MAEIKEIQGKKIHLTNRRGYVLLHCVYLYPAMATVCTLCMPEGLKCRLQDLGCKTRVASDHRMEASFYRCFFPLALQVDSFFLKDFDIFIVIFISVY